MHRAGRASARGDQYGFMVDHGSSVPLYVQVADDLRRRIRAGEYAPGQRLPSADDLHEIYDVAPEHGAEGADPAAGGGAGGDDARARHVRPPRFTPGAAPVITWRHCPWPAGRVSDSVDMEPPMSRKSGIIGG